MTKAIALADETIISKIYVIRGRKVMLDRDLAALYGIETRVLNQAVRRNERRFPGDFMFQLTVEELNDWKSQIVISNRERLGLRKPPLAFTEQGVAMLSSVLNSETAIDVNIQIMRLYTKMREMLMTDQEILSKLEQLELQTIRNTDDIRAVFDHLKQFLIPVEQAERRWIGFRTNEHQE